MKEIKLTRGHIALVDDADFDLLSQHCWRVAIKSHACYAITGQTRNETFSYMHHIILPAPLHYQVDHVDGNGLNNQRSNLRLATYSQNAANSKLSKTSFSNLRGVYLSRRGKWEAKIQVDSKLLHLGTFVSKVEAAIAYNKASNKFFW